MSQRVLGRAVYTAVRVEGLTTVIAAGKVSALNVKTDFEQLPFRIYPPMYGFYFVKPDILLPAERPFVYEEAIVFPISASHILIHDEDGRHEVPIISVDMPSNLKPQAPDPSATDYCVFSWVGTNKVMIGRCNAPVLAVYARVFGPASYKECEQYAQEAGDFLTV
jgi:hypothetical protein